MQLHLHASRIDCTTGSTCLYKTVLHSCLKYLYIIGVFQTAPYAWNHRPAYLDESLLFRNNAIVVSKTSEVYFLSFIPNWTSES